MLDIKLVHPTLALTHCASMVARRDETSTLIDLDHEIAGQDKTVYGDVEIPIPGDANPVPPPG